MSTADPIPRLHPFFRLLICVIGCVIVQGLVLSVVAVATAVAASIQGANANTRIYRFFAENLLLITLFVYPPTLLWLWVCRRFLDRRTFISLGLRARGFTQLFSGVLCGALASGLIFEVLVITGLVKMQGWSLAVQSGGAMRAVLPLFGWLGAMFAVGFMEEVAFRGYALHNLYARLGDRIAIWLQAIAFALVHLGNGAMQEKSTPDASLAAALAMPNIALIGIFFALCYFKTGSLWFPIGFHAAWNFCLGCVFSFPVSGIPIFKLLDVQLVGSVPLTGGSFGPEASVLLTPILIVLCLVMNYSRNSFLAYTDLKFLETGKSEAAVDMSSTEEDELRERRYRTSMRPPTLELDAETMATLRTLNAQSKEAEEQKRRDIYATLSTAVAPPEVLESTQQKPVEQMEKPASPPTPPVSVEPVITTVANSATTAENGSTIGPKKPKPRW